MSPEKTRGKARKPKKRYKAPLTYKGHKGDKGNEEESYKSRSKVGDGKADEEEKKEMGSKKDGRDY